MLLFHILAKHAEARQMPIDAMTAQMTLRPNADHANQPSGSRGRALKHHAAAGMRGGGATSRLVARFPCGGARAVALIFMVVYV